MAETKEMKEAYANFDKAVRELVQAAWPSNEEDDPTVVADWVLVVGQQFYDDEGDRAGMVSIMPRHGAQPSYITEGLLTSALNAQQNRTD